MKLNFITGKMFYMYPDLLQVTVKDRNHTGGIVEIINEAIVYLNHKG